MRIGELAGRTGVDQRLLRYYEQQGLLHPARRANGYREYEEGDVAAVAWIRRLLAAGLPTAVIAEFQFCVRDDLPQPGAACQRLYDRLEQERARIDTAIASLTASRAALDEVIGTARITSAAS
ncbi:MAG: MerR family transcriptional regulator [Actinomycetota bacterium]|nr:MerR family transcriptional regulator [Actinomycetota bacterium]